MGKKIKFGNKILFEIETINGEEFLVKHDKDATKQAGRPVFVRKPFAEIMKSNQPVIHLK